MNISRTRYLEPSRPGLAVYSTQTVYSHPREPHLVQSYGELEASDTFANTYRRFSTDNGRSWSPASVVITPEETPEGTRRQGESCYLLHPDTGRLYTFYNDHIYPDGHHSRAVMGLTKIGWKMTEPGATVFGEPRHLIVEGMTADEWAPGVRYRENSVMISFSDPFIDSRGRLILPAQRIIPCPESVSTYRIPLEAGCFIGTFLDDGDIRWQFSTPVCLDTAISSRGLCEPAIAELGNGDLLMIARGSNAGIPDTPGRKWVSTSTDGGATWSAATPLTDESGTPYFSSATGSRLLRHSRSKRLYWIGNLCETNPNGNAPRHPLFIGEIDEAHRCLLRSSLRIIDQRGPEDDDTLQLSNFRSYEDRETGEIVVLLCRLLAQTADKLHAPAYEYRISV